MKKLILILLFIAPLTVLAQTNFSGKWNLNQEKSYFNNAMEMERNRAATHISIEQSKDTLHVTYQKADGTPTIYALPLNGTAVNSHLDNGSRKEDRTTSLSWDNSKQKLTIKMLAKVDNGAWSYTRTDTYTLSSDGKIMTREHTAVLPDHTLQMTLIYDKQ